MLTDNIFTVTTAKQVLTTAIVLGAYGKRSNIDQVCLAILSKKNHRGWLLKHIIPGFSDDLCSAPQF